MTELATKPTTDTDLRTRMHAELDAWFDRVSADAPDGEMGEGASFEVKLYQFETGTDESRRHFDERLWTYTVRASQTRAQF